MTTQEKLEDPKYTQATLPLNDWRAAIELRRWLIATGKWTPEDDEMLIRSQFEEHHQKKLFAAMDEDDEGTVGTEVSYT
jgi:hypothetical protein